MIIILIMTAEIVKMIYQHKMVKEGWREARGVEPE